MLATIHHACNDMNGKRPWPSSMVGIGMKSRAVDRVRISLFQNVVSTFYGICAASRADDVIVRKSTNLEGEEDERPDGSPAGPERLRPFDRVKHDKFVGFCNGRELRVAAERGQPELVVRPLGSVMKEEPLGRFFFVL